MPLQNEPLHVRLLTCVVLVIAVVSGFVTGEFWRAAIFCALVVLIAAVTAVQSEIWALREELRNRDVTLKEPEE